MDDNLYPNDGRAFLEPIEQVNERNEEKAETLQALPVIKDTIARFKERIKFYEGMNGIPTEVLRKPDEFMHTVAANKMTVENLRVEKEWLEDLVERYFKQR